MLFIASSMLYGCGGSGSSTTSTAEVETFNFQLEATLANKCGNESAFNDVELLVQDDNWQIIERYSADDNGLISFTTTDEYINYTLVAKTQSGASVEGFEIKSFYQAKTTSTNTYAATYDALVDNDSCECVTNDLVLNHRALTTRRDIHSSLSYDSVESVDTATTEFKGVQACRVIGGDWPIASFMVSGESVTGSLIGAANFMTDFSEEEWSLSAIEIPEEVEVTANQALSYTTSQIFDESEHFLTEVSEGEQSLLVFNSHPYVSESLYHFYSVQTLAATSSIFSESSFLSSQQIISTSYTSAYDTEVSIEQLEEINIDYTNFSELAADGTYDYSAIQNHPMAMIKFTYNVLADTGSYYPVTWVTYGEEQGILASSVPLIGYDDFVGQDTTSIENTEVTLVQSGNTSNYQDYISFVQSNSTLDSVGEGDIDESKDFNHNIHLYYVSYQLK